ncbi:hypothetical protein HMH01_00730 [Halovulum dunhuangense]|uniref:Uncharacterized protein n=1 Tax=Halovulum dunhuangense TaxID=1505036 RepID=A0A849KQ46_9RHOB|nr:hypothetical protein [Halovulum dunhuangense]NNU78949.1 hypothetical protein [Halovulum dunhuangense]
MKAFLNRIVTAIRKRAAYEHTVAALSRLPLDVKLDLDIYQGDVRAIAHRAVYGA